MAATTTTLCATTTTNATTNTAFSPVVVAMVAATAANSCSTRKRPRRSPLKECTRSTPPLPPSGGGGSSSVNNSSCAKRRRKQQQQKPTPQHTHCSSLKRCLSTTTKSSSAVKQPMSTIQEEEEEEATVTSPPPPPSPLPSLPSITYRDIANGVPELFGNGVPPDCLSARIFTLFILTTMMAQMNQKKQQKQAEEQSRTHTPQQEALTESSAVKTTAATTISTFFGSHPLYSILKAVVEVEVVALQQQDQSNVSSSSSAAAAVETMTSSTEIKNKKKNKKKVSFCSFDCSSAPPPVDRVAGSDTYQLDAIDALVQVKRLIDDVVLLSSSSNAGSECTDTNSQQSAISSLVKFFRDLRGDDQLLDACAQSMMVGRVENNNGEGEQQQQPPPPPYPTNRVIKFLMMYTADFEIIQERCSAKRVATTFAAATYDNALQLKPLLLERRLAEFVGQAVRYGLRLLLNGTPPRLGPADTTYEDRTSNYSKVSSLIEMEHDTSLAVGDECMSALLSTTLQRLVEFFGMGNILNGTELQAPDRFCESPACQQEVSARARHPAPLNDVDVIFQDVTFATSFLAAAQACRFFVQVFGCPKVQAEIERLGGWPIVETQAAISYRFDLWKIIPNDTHLVVLSNHASLYAKLERVLPQMMASVPIARNSLQELEKRLRLHTKAAKLHRAHPWITSLCETLEEGRDREYAFPEVKQL